MTQTSLSPHFEDGEFLVGSRTRWITPENDNFGFAAWATQNKDRLIQVLGPGRHYGEWWGHGIQRGYGMPKGERHFSLFNTSIWEPSELPQDLVRVVPVLWKGLLDNLHISNIMDTLKAYGSRVAPFSDPEGVVVFHLAGNVGFKKTFDKDTQGKGDQS